MRAAYDWKEVEFSTEMNRIPTGLFKNELQRRPSSEEG
jgi:hypothetical protein